MGKAVKVLTGVDDHWFNEARATCVKLGHCPLRARALNCPAMCKELSGESCERAEKVLI